MFKVTVVEFQHIEDGEAGDGLKRFEQCVDELDITKLVAAINAKPRKARVSKKANSPQPT